MSGTILTNAKTNPSGFELSMLGLDEAEGSVKAKTKPKKEFYISLFSVFC